MSSRDTSNNIVIWRRSNATPAPAPAPAPSSERALSLMTSPINNVPPPHKRIQVNIRSDAPVNAPASAPVSSPTLSIIPRITEEAATELTDESPKSLPTTPDLTPIRSPCGTTAMAINLSSTYSAIPPINPINPIHPITTYNPLFRTGRTIPRTGSSDPIEFKGMAGLIDHLCILCGKHLDSHKEQRHVFIAQKEVYRCKVCGRFFYEHNHLSGSCYSPAKSPAGY